MVFNELSLTLADDIYSARERMVQLVGTMQAATKQGVKKILRTREDLNIHLLAENYPLVRWRNDAEVDRDTQRFFKNVATRYPYLSDVSDPNIINQVENSLFSYEENEAIGLGAAYLLDNLAISLPSHDCWNCHKVVLTYEQADDDGSSLVAEKVEVSHANVREHIKLHLPWIKQRLGDKVHSGADLWMQRRELFPHLEFCSSVEKQFQGILSGHEMLYRVKKRLLEFEKFCQGWNGGPFIPQKFVFTKARPQSQPTLDKYAKEHTFLCPDGQKRLFSLHIDLSYSERLHFYPDEDRRRIIVGYIGKHLPTVRG